MPQPFDLIASEKYISLETFRKDGSGVQTPVWAAPSDGKIYVFSEGKAWKVKRLRNDPRFRAAGCDMRGKVHGQWVEGKGRVLDDPAEQQRALAALERKYGLVMKMTNVGAKIMGRFDKRAYLEFTVEK